MDSLDYEQLSHKQLQLRYWILRDGIKKLEGDIVKAHPLNNAEDYLRPEIEVFELECEELGRLIQSKFHSRVEEARAALEGGEEAMLAYLMRT